MRTVSLFLLLTAAAGIGSAEAGLRENSWELGASFTHVDGDRDAGVDNGTGGTLRCGYSMSEKIEAEVLLLLSSADVNLLGVRDIPAEFDHGIVQIVGNFLNDRGYKHVPYISAGIGIINVTVDPFTAIVGNEQTPDPNDTVSEKQPEAFDSAALLSLAVGSRYFFNEDWAIRYELRYFHHDAFDEGQDVFVLDVGASWVIGGQR